MNNIEVDPKTTPHLYLKTIINKGNGVNEISILYRASTSLKERYYVDSNEVMQGYYQKYNKKGEVMEKGIYKDGLKNGMWKYYADGKLKMTGEYVDNKKEGMWKKYFNDSLYTEITYLNDKIVGNYISKHQNGNLKCVMKYDKKGVKHGLAEYYDENKTLINKFTYLDDKKQGEFVEYYADGTIKAEGNYLDNEYDGVCKWYFKNGQLASEEHYKKGKLKKHTNFDVNGKSIKLTEKELKFEYRDFKKSIDAHIVNEFNYPKNMAEQGYEGKVYVQFKIYADKSIEVLDIISDTHQDIENEARRIMEAFKPLEAMSFHNLPKQDTSFMIPIIFKLR